MTVTWRYFGTREPGAARAWAASGGVAVHENLFRSRGRRTAHLLARDEAALLDAARSLGCLDGWIQRTRTLHFDLVNLYLSAALRRCGVDPSTPPTQRTQATGLASPEPPS